MRLSTIAEVFGLTSYASAGATIRQLKARIECDAALGEMMQQLKCDLALRKPETRKPAPANNVNATQRERIRSNP